MERKGEGTETNKETFCKTDPSYSVDSDLRRVGMNQVPAANYPVSPVQTDLLGTSQDILASIGAKK